MGGNISPWKSYFGCYNWPHVSDDLFVLWRNILIRTQNHPFLEPAVFSTHSRDWQRLLLPYHYFCSHQVSSEPSCFQPSSSSFHACPCSIWTFPATVSVSFDHSQAIVLSSVCRTELSSFFSFFLHCCVSLDKGQIISGVSGFRAILGGSGCDPRRTGLVRCPMVAGTRHAQSLHGVICHLPSRLGMSDLVQAQCGSLLSCSARSRWICYAVMLLCCSALNMSRV